MNRTRNVFALILAAALVVVVGASLVLRPRVDLVLVNPGAAPVRVKVAGDPVEVPAAGTLRLAGVPAAGLRLEAPDAAPIQTDCPASALSAPPTWVWSVAPVGSWWEVSKGYGDQVHVGPSARPFVAPGALFPLPTGFLPLVDAPLPDDVRVKKGTTGVVRSLLWSDAYAAREGGSRGVTLFVHNSTQEPVDVRLEGHEEVVVLPDASHAFDLAAGPIALAAQARRTGEAFSAQVDLAPGPPLGGPAVYVWDVGQTSPWWVVSRRYGPDPEAGEPAPRPRKLEQEPGSAVFRLPAGSFPQIDVPFPEAWSRPEVLTMCWCESYFGRQGAAAAALEGLKERVLESKDRRTSLGDDSPARPDEVGPPLPPPPAEDAPFPPVGAGPDDGR